MLVKRTVKNQLTLPKAILKIAGMTDKDDYFDAEYDAKRHVICLRPVKVVIEETIPKEALERFEKEALTIRPGDKVFSSGEEAEKFLKKRLKK